jgi:hypothetical protein
MLHSSCLQDLRRLDSTLWPWWGRGWPFFSVRNNLWGRVSLRRVDAICCPWTVCPQAWSTLSLTFFFFFQYWGLNSGPSP